MSRRVTRRRDDAPPEPSLLNRPLVVGAIVGAVLLAVLMIVFASGIGRSTPEVTTSAPTQGRALGPAGAPVTIVEYSDFQCPFCARAARELIPPLQSEYIANGTVRFEFQPVAFLGQESALAAQAALCAEDQSQFWAMHDLLFGSQAGENRGAFSVENLLRFGEDLGLNMDLYSACLTTGKYQQTITDITREAQERGVSGTPSFFVDEQLVQGAVPYDDLKNVIEQHR